jgi:hypothetical protein
MRFLLIPSLDATIPVVEPAIPVKGLFFWVEDSTHGFSSIVVWLRVLKMQIQ